MKCLLLRIEGNLHRVMKLALLKILDIHKTTNKKFPKVVKKRSMQTQYLFEGVELWLRWEDFPSAPRLLKTIRSSYSLLMGRHCMEYLWVILVLSLFQRGILSWSIHQLPFLLWSLPLLLWKFSVHHCFPEAISWDSSIVHWYAWVPTFQN